MAFGQQETGPDNRRFHGRIEVTFLKWVSRFPNMAGVVSGDAGAGHFAGEILNIVPTRDGDKIEALHHINGRAFHFTAHNYITENISKGTAVIRGYVSDGPMKGAPVHGEFQWIRSCGIINAINGGDNTCYQGTLVIGPGSED
jgi:hypothetical protein